MSRDFHALIFVFDKLKYLSGPLTYCTCSSIFEHGLNFAELFILKFLFFIYAIPYTFWLLCVNVTAKSFAYANISKWNWNHIWNLKHMNKGNTCRWIRILYKGSKTRNTVPLSPNVSAFLLCPGLLAPDWQVGVASSSHSICGNGKIINSDLQVLSLYRPHLLVHARRWDHLEKNGGKFAGQP